MRFGEKIRKLRLAKCLTQRDLGDKVGVEVSYISKIENEKLDFGDFPSERLIQKLSSALGTDEFELLVLAEKVPPRVKQRLFQRPDAFRILVDLDDRALDGLLAQLAIAGKAERCKKRVRRRTHG